MTTDRSFVINEDHPCIQGHFPGNPIVPGVLILDNILRLIQSIDTEARLVKIRYMKFIKPLLPNHECRVIIDMTDYHTVKVTCSTGTVVIVRGQLMLCREGEE